MANAIVTVQGSAALPPTLLGSGLPRIPTGGKIRPGIMVLTKKAAALDEAKAIYQQGVLDGLSFEQIERALLDAIPHVSTPLVPRNVPWFTVRAGDFPNPEVPRQILETYGEDRGKGHRLYRFPVVFPADQWQSVMPHELAAWGTHEKRFWSQYAADGSARHCMQHAPVPTDPTGRRTIRLFGGRKAVQREANGGICNPESCAEYQARQCNLTGRFLFFIPGIRTINALELPTTSFYAMSNAIQRFQAIGHMRGGRISGFLGHGRETFYLTKVLRDVPHIDEAGRAVRVPQWIIELEAPIDVTALLRDDEEGETALMQAQLASQVLEGASVTASHTAPVSEGSVDGSSAGETPERPGHPTLEQVLVRAKAMGLEAERFRMYADGQWGRGWKINPHGRGRAWDEMVRYANDPEGYVDKIELALGSVAGGQ